MNVVNQIKALLGMEVKLAQMKLEDGVTVVEAEEFSADYSIGIVTEEGIIPLPVGDYVLEDGQKITVAQEGIIATVTAKEPEMEEISEPEMEAAPAAPAPKRVVESVSKETFFKSQLAEKDAEIARLKTELAKHETKVELEAAPQPIVHNPEPKKVEVVKLSANRPMTIQDKVNAKLYGNVN